MVTNGPGQRGESIVVTGIGISTSLGFGAEKNWERLLAGESAIAVRPAEEFPLPLKLPVRLGAAIPRDELAGRIRSAVPRAIWNTSEEVCHLWLLTASEALDQAGVTEEGGPPAERVGIFVGTGAGPTHFTEREFVNIFTAKKAIHRDVSRMAVSKYMSSSLAGNLSLLKGLRGPSMSLNTACSSGATAMVTALDALRLGRVDCAVAGGVDMPMVGTVLKGFYKISALTTQTALGPRASRPFDAQRDGMVLGEGAGCLVLERESVASARGRSPLAVLNGGAAISEAHHLLSPKDNGQDMAQTMRLALDDAGMEPARIAHVYAHGTGTFYNDACEAAALDGVLHHRPTVSATKAQLGHTIGGAAAIDAALAVLSLARGQVVPMVHLNQLDQECPILPARKIAHRRLGPGKDGAVLVNAFAFGGHNTSLVFSAA
ncbi:MAG: beta-ketoacyl-[acyl-carrier-protein] synthase family protein [bacterium]